MKRLETDLIDILVELSKKSRKKLRDDYKKWIRKQPCIIAGLPDADRHHIRNINELSGAGQKPTDDYIVPLCHELHQEVHLIGVDSFEKKYNIIFTDELEKLHDKFIIHMRDNQ